MVKIGYVMGESLDIANIRRCLKLYAPYWCFLLVFVVLIGMLLTIKYVFDIIGFSENIIG